MMSAYEDLEATIFNLLHGFYRQSFNSLRSTLELITVGSCLQITNQQQAGEEWALGIKDISFGNACDSLQKTEKIKQLEINLLKETEDTLFGRKDPKQNLEAGWLRRLYSKLSKYSHASPGYTNGDLWQSNGPIFNIESFKKVVECYQEVLIACVLLVKIAKTRFTPGRDGIAILSDLFDLKVAKDTVVLEKSINYLFNDRKAVALNKQLIKITD